jgi:hypothetical protein
VKGHHIVKPLRLFCLVRWQSDEVCWVEVIQSNPCIRLVRREDLVEQQVAANPLWNHWSYQDRNGLVLVFNGELIGCGVAVTVLWLIDLFLLACGCVLCEHLWLREDQNNLKTILKRSGCRSAAADTRSLDLSIDYLISETSMSDSP